jgi:D-alanyl-D-alanine carboxypeptidase (penicillin-binding protein 5/6)
MQHGRRTQSSMSSRVNRRAFVLGAFGLAGAIALAPAPALAQSENALAPSGLTARSVYVFDSTSNVLIYSANPHQRLAVGSLTKIVTALVTVTEVADLQEQVKIDSSDVYTPEELQIYSNMQLQADDTLTVSQLLYGMLIPSGNDGGMALARYVGNKLTGSNDPDTCRSAFIDRMNQYCKDLGLENSQFQTPDGVDAKDQFSTAHDIAILFAELMKHDRLREIDSTPAYQFTSVGPEARTYQEDTTNKLLGQDGVIGGKTGTTEEAGANVVLARETTSGNTCIIAIVGADVTYNDQGGIVDGSDTRWNDAQALMSDMDEQIAWVTPPDDETMPGLADELDVWAVTVNEAPAVPMRTDGDAAAQLVLGEPVAAGEEAGRVELYYASTMLGSFPVYQAG